MDMQYFVIPAFYLHIKDKILINMKQILKSLKVLFVSAFALPFVFQSCNSDGEEQLYALVSFVNNGVAGDFSAVMDNGDKIYFSDKGNYKSYSPKNGQRAVIYFTQFENPVSGYKYNARLLAVNEILTKDVVTLYDSEKDTLGNLSIAFRSASISGGYLNIDFGVKHRSDIVHYFNVVNNQLNAEDSDKATESDGYTVLEFRHKTKDDKTITEDSQLVYTSACFRLGELNPEFSGTNGILLKYKDYDSVDQVVKINYKSSEK